MPPIYIMYMVCIMYHTIDIYISSGRSRPVRGGGGSKVLLLTPIIYIISGTKSDVMNVLSIVNIILRNEVRCFECFEHREWHLEDYPGSPEDGPAP